MAYPYSSRASGRVPAVLLALLALFLKVLTTKTAGPNSDEPQHLHVVWEWTRGALQYRDIFDNHTPLFHMVHAPILDLVSLWVGESSETLVAMRYVMIIWYVLALVLAYRIAKILLSKDLRLWAVLLTAFFPWFFFITAQYRTDNLWMVMWLTTISLVMSNPLTPTTAAFLGVLFALTFATSMKSVLLIAAFFLAGVLCWCLNKERRMSVTRSAALGLSSIAGAVLVLCPLILFFYRQGALEAFLYCTIEHNYVPGLASPARMRILQWVFPVTLPILIWSAAAIRQSSSDKGPKLAFLFLVVMLYCSLIVSYWPLVTDQNFLPIMPLVIILLLALYERLVRRDSGSATNEERGGRSISAPLVCILLLMIVLTATAKRPWKNRFAPYARQTDTILSLTEESDFVMDKKGETVFRHRPYYYALENITEERLKRGLIPDSIAEHLIATKTGVIRKLQLPAESSRFVRENYLEVGDGVLVLGKSLVWDPETSSFQFDVPIPGRYVTIGAGEVIEGSMDGLGWDGSGALEAGRHSFETVRSVGDVAILSEQPFLRGARPQ